MDTINVVDTKILSAFEEAHLDQEYHCATFRAIAQFQILTPSLLGQSFKALATLSDTVNLEAPSLQMVLGKGSVFATRCSLHSYHNAMIEGYHCRLRQSRLLFDRAGRSSGGHSRCGVIYHSTRWHFRGRHGCVPFPSFRVLQTDKGLFSACHSVSNIGTPEGPINIFHV
jgi:hypothetical protein